MPIYTRSRKRILWLPHFVSQLALSFIMLFYLLVKEEYIFIL